MYNRHSDEYQMKAVDVDELVAEYDVTTEAGRARDAEYEKYKARACKLFSARHKEMLFERHHAGHIIKPMEDFLASKKQ